MRRFSYVLEWAGVVVIVSTLIVRGPLLLAYFRNLPGVLDYLPLERLIMSAIDHRLLLRPDFAGAP